MAEGDAKERVATVVGRLDLSVYNRRVTNRPTPSLMLVLSLLLTASCTAGPLQVGAIQIGRSLNEDNSIGSLAAAFKPNDTIYVSIHTTATGSGTITVRWSYRGALMSERSKQVSFKGAGATEFHIQSASGFPPGDYDVEVLLDGKPVGRRSFSVGE